MEKGKLASANSIINNDRHRQYTSWGWKREESPGHFVGQHWGFWVDNQEPITGVLSNHDIEWLQDAMYYEDGIDLAYENHVRDEHGGDYELCDDDCGWAEPFDCSGTYLIGDWKVDSDGLYDPIENGPRGYAAITGEIYTQVVWSKYTTRCNLCSPCYPGQGSVNPDKPIGIWLAYTMPPEYLYSDEKLIEHIRYVQKTLNASKNQTEAQ